MSALRIIAIALTFGGIAHAEESSETRRTVTLQCDKDLRCKFDRARSESAERRREDLARERALELVDRERIARLRREAIVIRRLRQWNADVFLSTSDVIGQGVSLAWNPSPQWQIRGLLTDVSAYEYLGGGGTNAYGMLLGARATLYLLRTDSTVYVSGGATWHDLDMYSWGGWDGGEAPPEDFGQDLVGSAHSALLSIGFDHTFRFGLHLGLELQYLAPFYVQARGRDSGLPVVEKRTSLENALAEDAWGVGFIFGWSL